MVERKNKKPLTAQILPVGLRPETASGVVTGSKNQGQLRTSMFPEDSDPLLNALTEIFLDEQPPEEILGERYLLLRPLGRGAFGVVYEAEDLRDQRLVALKILNSSVASWLHQFKREFRALQGLSHPNLISLDELFEERGKWFFTMELVSGLDFFQYTRGEAKGSVEGSQIEGRQNDGKQVDEAKLRESLAQLLSALEVLHSAGRVHRDIKPLNVLVEPEGRLVLIDFGLAIDSEQAIEWGVAGTPAYMPPEQAIAGEVGPPADLYAVGVMLYECLTGALPFSGGGSSVISNKRTQIPSFSAQEIGTVALDLQQLTLSLLHVNPQKRPTAKQARLRLLSKHLTVPRPTARAAESPKGIGFSLFVGRHRELDLLFSAFATGIGGQASSILITGESGIGKTSLVEKFARTLLEQDPTTLIVTGRCYERENIPFKAMDGLVDSLGLQLAQMSQGEVSQLLPARYELLGHLFPSLLRIAPLKQAWKETPLPDWSPQLLRERALQQLIALFSQVAKQRTVVLIVDDLQWADREGLTVLEMLLAETPATSRLFIGTMRSAQDALSPVLDQLLASLPRVQCCELRGLTPAEGRELAGNWLHADSTLKNGAFTDHASTEVAEHLVGESQGHPLFLRELVSLAEAGGAPSSSPRLDSMLWDRIEALEPLARILMELLAAAERPIRQQVIITASGCSSLEFRDLASQLRNKYLIGTSGLQASDLINSYHGRIRETVLAQMNSDTLCVRHQAIADALSRAVGGSVPDVNPATLARHLDSAGNAAAAAEQAVLAGRLALRSFAFEAAIAWFEMALKGFAAGHSLRSEALEELGNALALAGRGVRAAAQFQEAAGTVAFEKSLELQRRTAEELLACGQLDEGLEVGHKLLGMVGLRFPVGRRAIALTLLKQEIALRLIALPRRQGVPRKLDKNEQLRIDTCWSVARALVFADPMTGYMYGQMSLILALRSGHAVRMASPLAMISAMHFSSGGKSSHRGGRMLKLALRFSRLGTTKRDRVVAGVGAGLARLFRGQFGLAANRFSEAISMAESSHGIVFERVALHSKLFEALGYLGRFRELCERHAFAEHDARTRGDLYATVTTQVGFGNFAFLVQNRPEESLAALQSVGCTWSAGAFYLEHFSALKALVILQLYRRQYAEAHRSSEELLRKTKASLLWRIQYVRIRVLYAGGFSALALLQSRGGNAKLLAREVKFFARKLERENMAWVAPFANVLRAGLAQIRGKDILALSLQQRALLQFSENKMTAYAQATRYRIAQLRADADTSQELSQVVAALQAETVVKPVSLIDALVPRVVPG